MRLIYINELGFDYKGQKQYEFIFSQGTEFEIDSWYSIPASISPELKVPDIEYIDVVGVLKDSDLELELIQDSDVFGVIDAVEGVVSLGWEKFDIENDNRLSFKFGDTLENVIKKLNTKGYILNYGEVK